MSQLSCSSKRAGPVKSSWQLRITTSAPKALSAIGYGKASARQ
jgi:hypothetical protein